MRIVNCLLNVFLFLKQTSLAYYSSYFLCIYIFYVSHKYFFCPKHQTVIRLWSICSSSSSSLGSFTPGPPAGWRRNSFEPASRNSFSPSASSSAWTAATQRPSYSLRWGEHFLTHKLNKASLLQIFHSFKWTECHCLSHLFSLFHYALHKTLICFYNK